MGRKRSGRDVVFTLAAVLAPVLPGEAAGQRAVEVHVGGGYTVVDVQAASGQSGSVQAEEQGMFQVLGRVLFLPLGRAMAGIEAGYRYLYYYEVPSPPSGFVPRDIAPTWIGGVIKLPLPGGLAIEGGGGAHIYEETTSLSLFGAAGFDLGLAPRIAIPIRVRADMLLEDPSVIPVGGTLGLAIRF